MSGLSKARSILGRVNRHMLKGCEWLTISLVAAITIVVCAGVFWRYVLNDALSWSEETAKFLMVWLVFAASPIALAHGTHAAIDAFPEALPPRLRNAVFAFIHVLILAFVYILITQGYGFALNARVQHTPTTGISMMYIFAAMPAGGVLLGMVSAARLLDYIRWSIRPGEEPVPTDRDTFPEHYT